MSQTQATIPQIALTPGTRGPFTTGIIPSTASQFVVKLNKVVWPAAGTGPVMTLTLDESKDGGQTWQLSAQDTWDGGLTQAKGGGTLTTDVWTTDLLYPQQPNCKLRLTLQVFQDCTVSGSIDIQ